MADLPPSFVFFVCICISLAVCVRGRCIFPSHTFAVAFSSVSTDESIPRSSSRAVLSREPFTGLAPSRSGRGSCVDSNRYLGALHKASTFLCDCHPSCVVPKISLSIVFFPLRVLFFILCDKSFSAYTFLCRSLPPLILDDRAWCLAQFLSPPSSAFM